MNILTEKIESSHVGDDKSRVSNGIVVSDNIDDDVIRKEWGFALPELYRVVVKFYKGELYYFCYHVSIVFRITFMHIYAHSY